MQIEGNTSENDMIPWHALYTHHQHEKLLQQILVEKGFETFLPLYSVTHRWKDRVQRLSVPLFPSYVFIHGGLDRRLDLVTTTGFHSIVANGERPGTILQQEIDAIRQLIETKLQVEPHPFLKVGDRVRVKSGPLSGFEGILVRKKNHCRLVLSVELLQKSVATEVDASTVERVSAFVRPRQTTPSRCRSSYGSAPLSGLLTAV
jgi:transcription antitermination factor NusG